MPAKLYIIISLLFVSLKMCSQTNIGIFGGLSLIHGNNREAQIGLFLEKPISENWAIQPEISYLNMKWKRSMLSPQRQPYQFEALSKHIEFQLPFKRRIQVNKGNVYGKLGAYATYLAKIDGRIIVDNGMETSIRKLKLLEETNLSNIDFGLSLAIGFEYGIGQGHKVMSELANRIGIIDTNLDDSADDYSNGIMINIGMIYCIPSKS